MNEPVGLNDTGGAGSGAFARRNYFLGIANGALGRAGFSLLNPHLVLAAFVYKQTGSSALVGLLAALSSAGVFLPQLYMSRLIEHRPRKKPFYVAATIVRLFTLLGMISAMWFFGTSGSRWLLALFFCTFFIFRAAQGCGAIPFLDIVGQTITPLRLGRFFGWRAVIGDSLALFCGLLIAQPVLDRVSSPASYVILSAAGAVMLGAAWWIFSLADEEEDSSPPEERTFRETLVEAARLLKHNANYRCLLLIRALVRVNILALAFYVPYGQERLGAVGISGVFLAFASASRIASSLFWGRTSDRKGNRLCLLWAGLFFALSPATALVAPALPGVFAVTLPFTSVTLDLPLCVYLLSLCFFSAAFGANNIGTNALLIESAPPDRRPSYIALLNTVTAPLTVLPLAAGLLVDKRVLGLTTLFAIITAGGVLSFIAAARLTEVRQLQPADGAR